MLERIDKITKMEFDGCYTVKKITATNIFILLLFFSLLFSLFSTPLLAQGCAMCKTVVVAQEANMIEALNLGIIVLMVPPIGILATILVFVFRYNE